MIPGELEKSLIKVKKEGKRILAVVANACATTTGLYDPLQRIGVICKEHGVWFHVDGAHGASALISSKYKRYMKGAELADSMIWDTHKMLRTTTLAAAVLFKDTDNMINTFKQKGSYLFHEKENKGFDLMPFTIECTKAPLATKLFWVLAAEGESGIERYLDQQFEVTKEIYNYLNTHEDFECPYMPESNIICFRYKSGKATNDYQLSLRNEIVKNGKFYITSAEFKDVRYLRFTVINSRTTIEQVKQLIMHIADIAPSLN
jgi:L-2,4-diaminobutyrate decarboxylase